jgi:hypothetical protein
MKRTFFTVFAALMLYGSNAYATPIDIVDAVKPATMLFLGFGLIGLAAVGRKRLR